MNTEVLEAAVSENRILETVSSLRELLNEIYSSSELYGFDRLVERYHECFVFDFSILFYIRERQWFDEPQKQIDSSSYLKFHYLSFEIKNHKVRRFAARDALTAREKSLVKDGYSLIEDKLCNICVLSDPTFNLNPIYNLTRRIFVSFYRNCGSKEHFLKSVSLRFVRQFYKETQNTSDQSIQSYLTSRLQIDVYILEQKDELFFKRGATFTDLIKDKKDTRELPRCVINSAKFLSDFITSVTRKNQTFGETELEGTSYVINTFTEEYLIYSARRNRDVIKSKQKFTTVYFRSSGAIDLDEVYIANKLVEIVKRQSQDEAKDQLTLGIYSKIHVVEDNLSENPVINRSDFREFSLRKVKEQLNDAIKGSLASSAIYYEYSISRGQLVPILCEGNIEAFEFDQLLPISINTKEHSPYWKCIHSGQTLDIWHSRKLLTEVQASKSLSHAEYEFNTWLDEAERLEAQISVGERASVLVPVYAGKVPAGLIEFFSRSESRLSPDLPIYKIVGGAVGDSLRRLFLANDRGWLAKMSYIHSARHNLENLRRKLAEKDPNLSDEFKNLFESSFHDNHKPKIKDECAADPVLNARQRLKDATSAGFAEEVWEKLVEIGVLEHLSINCLNSVITVLDALHSNKEHSGLSPNDVTFSPTFYLRRFSYLDIVYRPLKTNSISRKRAERICVSPIEHHSTPTYHYGLFLCAAQTRMQGGLAEFLWNDEKEQSRNVPFGLVFRLA